MDDWSERLASWSEFLIFHVLPTAVARIYDWVREWQILVAAAIVLIFFQFWTRAILRAARRTAKETVQTEAKAFGASLTLLRRQVEDRAPPRPAPGALPDAPRAAEPRPLRPAPPENPPLNGQAAIEHLRQAIRLALGKIPHSDEPLSPEGTKLYKSAIGALADAGVISNADVVSGGFGQIMSELSALQQSFPPESCRQAWQSLVKVNALAREFHETGSAPAPTP